MIDKFRPVDILVNTPGIRDISGLFPFVAVYQLWIVSARRLGKDVRTLRGETSLLNATLLPPDSKTGRAGHFASQTTRLSSSSTRRLIKVADLRLLRGMSLGTRINLLNTIREDRLLVGMKKEERENAANIMRAPVKINRPKRRSECSGMTL